MKEIVADLVPKLRNALLSDPVCRPAVIEWASQPDRSSDQELERASMVEALVGSDFAKHLGNR